MSSDQAIPGPVSGVYIVLFLLLASLASAVEGQRFNVHYYGHAQGLPQIQAYTVFQDQEGYIWVGSNSGLARYDGREFHSITAADGLAHNTVSHIDALPDGTLVAGTRAGVCFLESGIRSCVLPEDGLVTGQLRDLHLDRDGSVWVAADDGLSHIREGRWIRSYGPEDGLPPGRVLAVARDRDGTLWTGTDEGLARLVGEGWEEVRPLSGIRTQAAALQSHPEGILVGTGRGLFLETGEGFRPIPLGPGPELVRDLALGPDGTVWAGTPDHVYRIRGSLTGETEAPEVTSYSAENGFPNHDIWDLHADREGNLWMGSDHGLWKFVPGPLAFYTDAEGLPNPFVRALALSPDGRVWMGTRDGLAVWEDGEIREVSLGPRAVDSRVYALAVAPGGGLLVGTGSGLLHRRFTGEDRHFGVGDGLPHEHVLALLPDGRGGVWVGTPRGLVRWTPAGLVPAPMEGLRSAGAASLAYDGRGRLWVGLTYGGLLVADGDSIQALGAAEGMSEETIWSLYPDPEGGMWVGSNGDGAFLVRGDSVARQLREEDGLAQDFVWQVLVDRRADVWLFTGAGLNRITTDGMTHYGTAEGLQDLEGAANAILEDHQSLLWFGTGTGIYRFDPELEQERLPAPRVNLESITQAGEPRSPSETVFPPGPGVLAFRFSAPTYRDESGIRFRYRLAGTGDSWAAPVSDPTVRFAGLGHGDYRLEVVAETDQGARSAEPLVLSFSVRPTFWQTWWFRGLALLLALLAVLSIPFLRSRHMRAEQARLQALVHEHTMELEEKTHRLEEEIREREESDKAREELEVQLIQSQKMEAVGRLAGGIAHDFNNLLTSIMGYAEVAASELPEDHAAVRDLREIRTAGGKAAQLVSQLLAFSRRQVVERTTLDLGEVVAEAGDILQRTLGERVHLDLDLHPDPLPMVADRAQLEQMVMHLSLNARDAMPQGGTLTVSTRPEEVKRTLREGIPDEVQPGRYVVLEVSDQGRGMDPDTLGQIFEPFFTTKAVGEGSGLGLAMVYGAVHQQDGAIQVVSEAGKGTIFRLFFPEAGAEAGE